MNEKHTSPNSERLREDLRALVGPRRALSTELRQRMLERAAERCPRPRLRRRRPWLGRGRVAAAAATAAVLAVLILNPLLRGPSRPAGDVDGDGVVNVRDAYLLARSLRSEVAPAAGTDLDGDGRVDQSDVERLLERIVSIEGGRS